MSTALVTRQQSIPPVPEGQFPDVQVHPYFIACTEVPTTIHIQLFPNGKDVDRVKVGGLWNTRTGWVESGTDQAQEVLATLLPLFLSGMDKQSEDIYSTTINMEYPHMPYCVGVHVETPNFNQVMQFPFTEDAFFALVRYVQEQEDNYRGEQQ